jgi:chromobox protein 3
VDGKEEYKVEKILDMKPRGQGCKMYCLVKWKGYPTSDNSWEPAENLHAKELIKRYKEENTGTNKKRR